MNKIAGMDENEIKFFLPFNKNAYLKRFSCVEKGRITFNFGAAILGEVWFAYQFMIKGFIIVLVLMTALNTAASIKIYSEYSTFQVINKELITISFYIIFLKAVVYGILGDRILLHSIKKRVARDNQDRHKNILGQIASIIEHSEKRGLFRGVTVVVSAWIVILCSKMLVPFLVGLYFY